MAISLLGRYVTIASASAIDYMCAAAVLFTLEMMLRHLMCLWPPSMLKSARHSIEA